MKTSPEKSPFSAFHHVTIVVKNLENTMNYYESIGIGPFRKYDVREYKVLQVKDKVGFSNLKVREARTGTVWIQLVEPGEGESIYKDMLKKEGEGVQHLGYVVKDIEKAESQLVAKGVKIIEKGRRTDGSGFTYFDTSAIGGTIFSIRQSPSDWEDFERKPKI